MSSGHMRKITIILIFIVQLFALTAEVKMDNYEIFLDYALKWHNHYIAGNLYNYNSLKEYLNSLIGKQITTKENIRLELFNNNAAYQWKGYFIENDWIIFEGKLDRKKLETKYSNPYRDLYQKAKIGESVAISGIVQNYQIIDLQKKIIIIQLTDVVIVD